MSIQEIYNTVLVFTKATVGAKTQAFADTIGADAQSADAQGAVKLVKQIAV